MILIADSGSTKTQWCFAENGKIFEEIFTVGINPFYQTAEDIKEIVLSVKKQSKLDINPNHIFFYGAGCIADKKNIIHNILGKLYSDSIIEVESDLLAAARALLQHQAGIACILGTGSNSCFYDGMNIKENVSSLGFILGDEGSGAVLGKNLVSDILKKQAPKNIQDLFFKSQSISPTEIINAVYKKPFPNRYLAQFCKFIYEHKNDAYTQQLLQNNFHLFFERNILQYDYDTYAANFVGSIAYYFAEELKKAALISNVRVQKIEASPMKGLLKFHQN